LDAADVGGFTALHVAAYNGRIGVVRLLVSKGADVKAHDEHGRTAEQIATERGFKEVEDYLRLQR
jgi:ankyrin repeat protein